MNASVPAIPSAAALQIRLQSEDPPVLIQVLPEDIFQAKRIPGARQACVYEMTFLDQVGDLGILRDQELVVYGAGNGSHDARVAREKLEAAGYQRVLEYPGGLVEWERVGLALEGERPLPKSPEAHGRYVVDTEGSLIR